MPAKKKQVVVLGPHVPGMQETGALVIKTNKWDKEYAEKQDQWNCLFVRAIQRTIPEALRVRVNKDVVAYTIGGHRYEHSAPKELVDKIEKPFDLGRKVPDTVTIELPPPTKIRQVERLTPEKKQRLRQIQRVRQAKERRQPPGTRRDHGRFCETDGDLGVRPDA